MRACVRACARVRVCVCSAHAHYTEHSKPLGPLSNRKGCLLIAFHVREEDAAQRVAARTHAAQTAPLARAPKEHLRVGLAQTHMHANKQDIHTIYHARARACTHALMRASHASTHASTLASCTAIPATVVMYLVARACGHVCMRTRACDERAHVHH